MNTCPTDQFEELEFICANTNYCGYASLRRKQRSFYKFLTKKKSHAFLPYMQVFDYGKTDKQQSFAIILLQNDKTKQKLLKQAKRRGLQLDLVNCVDERHIQLVRAGRKDGYLEGIIRPRWAAK